MRSKIYRNLLLLTCCLLVACGVDKNLKKAEKYLALGEYYDAGNEFRQAYQKTPPKERELRGLRAAKVGYCYDKIGESQRAIGAYRNVIRYKQDNAATHLALADNLMKTGSYREAEKEYQATLDMLEAPPQPQAEKEEPTVVSKNKKKTVRKERTRKSRQTKTSGQKASKASGQKAERQKKSARKPTTAAKATVRRQRVLANSSQDPEQLAAKTEKQQKREQKKADKRRQKEERRQARRQEIEEALAKADQEPETRTIDTQQELTAKQLVLIQSAAMRGLQSAQAAAKQKAAGSRYKVKKMDVFNSRRSDYSPMLFGDQYEQLYWTSTRNEAQGDELSGITGTKPADIFYAEKDDKGKWSKPQEISTGLNTEAEEGTPAFSVDGREMYITQCLSDPEYPRYAQIAVSNRSDAAWGKATKLEISKDTLSSFAHPALSPDGNWIYFVSDMPGGKGGFDIWRARITGGSLGGVQNLGEPINTPGDEMFPTFRPNGDLYFSSNGHADGLGGLDIYIAAVGEDHKYHLSHPGFPLNSQGDDFGMTFEGPHNRGFFSSNRGDAKGWDHLYSFELPEIVQTVKGWVYEMEGYELPAAQVYMVGDDGTNLKLSVKGDGSFEQVINPQVSYVMMATCKGYLNHKEELRVDQTPESEEYVLQFPLASIRVPVMIDNIFYDFDKATLRPESETALDDLVKLLNENPNVTIELSAHCDFKGSADYNKRLSQRRAESVVNYLVAHGIAADRLSPVGYGKEKPKTVRKKLTETYPWLKENQMLTEEYVKTLDKDQQEVCNQLNRRTEFIVLRTTYGMFDEKGNLKNPPQPSSGSGKEELDEDGFDIYVE